MRKILHGENEMSFFVDDTFHSEYYVPIIDNLREKAESTWDNYDEVFHAMQLLHQIKETNKHVLVEFHSCYVEEQIVGIAVVSRGEITEDIFFEEQIQLPKSPVILNYFHISHRGRGVGKKWLKTVIFPYYQAIGYTKMYVKTTHAKAFSLYESFGKTLASYEIEDDLHLETRFGKIFELSLID